jgi:hypothetical protein
MKIKRLLCLSILVMCSACEGFDPNAYVPGLYTPTPMSSPETPAPAPASTVPAPVATAVMTPRVEPVETITVCTNIPGGKLNVRFSAGEKSDVRGYLAEGETVTLSGDRKVLDKNTWVKLKSPIEGWVNEIYLCEATP